VHGDEAEHSAHRELRLVHRLRIDDRAEHVDRALVDVRSDGGDVLGAQAVGSASHRAAHRPRDGCAGTMHGT
jgi:hypothetical protein